jgi:hypothetical protein
MGAYIQLPCGCSVVSPEWFVTRYPDWKRLKAEVQDVHECPATPDGPDAEGKE